MKKVFVLLIAMLCLAGFAMASEAPDVSRAGPFNLSAGFGPLLAVPGFVVDLAPPAFTPGDVLMTVSLKISDLLNARMVLSPYKEHGSATITRNDRCTQLANSLALPTLTIDLRRFATIYDTRARPAHFPIRT